jgi:hypothetical protein
MTWGEVELEPEVEKWFDGLGQDERASRAMDECIAKAHTAEDEE